MSPVNFIRRKAENLSTAIEQIYGLRVSNEADKSLKLASETFSSLLSFDLQQLLETDNETFLNNVIVQSYSPEFTGVFVKFLLETADVFSLLNRSDDSKNLKIKVLKLLRYLNETDKTYSEERLNQIDLLASELL